MKPWIRRSLTGLVALVALAGATVGYALHRADSRMQRQLALPAYALQLHDDARAVERGRYLYASRGCADCHGANAGGRVFIDDTKTGLKVAGPNISRGDGSAAKDYGPADWERTLRHGVKPGGRPAMIMPSEDFARWTDDDVAAVAAYVRQLPPVAGGAVVMQLPLPVRALYGLGVIQDAAEKIDHTLPPAQPVAEAVTVEHGRYVAQGCQGCHGQNLSGGKIPGGPPDWPAAANLTSGEGSVLPRYADATAFRAMLRGGKRPDGSAIAVMPFEALSKMSDVDIDAMYLYLKGLPPRAAGRR